MKITSTDPKQAPVTTPSTPTGGPADESVGDVLRQADRLGSQVPVLNILLDKVAHKGRKFDDVWKSYQPYSPGAPVQAGSVDQLRKDLGIDANWSNAPQLKRLVDSLDQWKLAGTQNLTNLEKVVKQQGLRQAELIARTLADYVAATPADTPEHKLEQRMVVQNALEDVATPSSIDQSNKPTCTVTAVQMKLAIERPLQYVQMLTTLARDKEFPLTGGDVLKPNNFWRGDKGDYRSYSAKILENSLMDFGRRTLGIDFPYNSEKSKSGLAPFQYAKIIKHVFGDSAYTDHTFMLGRNMLKQVEDDLARGRTAVVSFDGHTVLAVGMDKTQSPARVIMDSWGGHYSLTEDEFIHLVRDVVSYNDPGSNDLKTPDGKLTLLGDRS